MQREAAPSVTSVVLNYGTPVETLKAVDSLLAQNYSGQHRVIAIDNMSRDNSRDLLAERIPDGAELIMSDTNRGFGGGLNLVLRDLHTDYAFILNSDARCDRPDVLTTLVDRAERGSRVGAVAPKITFDERWIRILLDGDVTLPLLAGERDRRVLGAAVVGATENHHPVRFENIIFEAGFHDVESVWGRPLRRSLGRASLLVPVAREATSGSIALHVMTDFEQTLAIETGDDRQECILRPTASSLADTHRPHTLSLSYGPDSEVLRINNAGSHLKGAFHGSDRGFGSFSSGQFETADPVFAFCGAAALLSASALEEAGLFDARYFLYYEDTELSWRMQKAGFSIWYEPRAVVRHGLSRSTGGEKTDLFKFHVWRNRLFMLTSHARPRDAFRAVVGASISLLRQLVRPWSSRARHNLVIRTRVLNSYLRALPRLIRER